MQQVQDRLNFEIETPSDEEIARRFADHQKAREHLYRESTHVKPKKRVKKSAKKLARLNKNAKRAKYKRKVILAGDTA